MATYRVEFGYGVEAVHNRWDKGSALVWGEYDAFTPDEAREFAQALLEAADMAELINGD